MVAKLDAGAFATNEYAPANEGRYDHTSFAGFSFSGFECINIQRIGMERNLDK